LETRLTELSSAAEREQDIVVDARNSRDKAKAGIEALDKESAEEKSKLAEAETLAIKADEIRREKETILDDKAREAAEKQAALESARRDQDKLEIRLEQISREIETAQTERDSLRNSTALNQLEDAEQAVITHDNALETAKAQLQTAETTRREAEASSQDARETLRQLSSVRETLEREAKALERILASTLEEDANPALDSVRARPGYEHALAAALGDDLDASLDETASRHWDETGCKAGMLPGGCVPLSDHVDAPKALKARLDAVGVIKPENAAKALRQLLPGQKLVTRDGDVWRWDGLVARADAPSAAVARLEQRNRLEAIAEELANSEEAILAAKTASEHSLTHLEGAKQSETSARSAIAPAEQAARQALSDVSKLRETAAKDKSRSASLDEILDRLTIELEDNQAALKAVMEVLKSADLVEQDDNGIDAARLDVDTARITAADTRAALESLRRESELRRQRRASMQSDHDAWAERCDAAATRIKDIISQTNISIQQLEEARARPEKLQEALHALTDSLEAAIKTAHETREAASLTEDEVKTADSTARSAETTASAAREARAANEARLTAFKERLNETTERLQDATGAAPGTLAARIEEDDAGIGELSVGELEKRLNDSRMSRERLGAVNLRAEQEAEELATKQSEMTNERDDLLAAIGRLRKAVDQLSREGRARLLEAFEIVDGHFRSLFATLFDGGQAELRLTEHDDPLEAGLEIYACPPGKKLDTMMLMSGGEQALTASALIFAVFLSNPAPVCVLDEVDAPLDDSNVDRYCRMLDEMRRLTETRFLVITHNPLTMSRVDRLYGVTMAERGVSQLVSVDLVGAEQLVAAE